MRRQTSLNVGITASSIYIIQHSFHAVLTLFLSNESRLLPFVLAELLISVSKNERYFEKHLVAPDKHPLKKNKCHG